MAVLLILVSLVATVASFALSGSDGVRSALLKAAIVHALVIAISTELFSASRSLNLGWVVWLWSLMAVINSLLLARLWYQQTPQPNPIDRLTQLRVDFKQQPWDAQLSILAVGLILGSSLVVAIVAPPNNYDSLTYHMPRVMHWIQNQSVAHYPTPNLRQISFPPLSGYIITHLYLLANSDYFANLVQWLSFLGCVLGTSLIARHLGVSQRGTALVCATVPMAILQAMTTQNDLVVSFWLVCFAYFLLRTETYGLRDGFWLASSIGLAILTKPTGIVVGVPLLALLGYRIWGGFSHWRNWQRLLKGAIVPTVVTLAGLALSLPSYGRNFQTFGNPLGIDGGTRNDLLGIVPLCSNLLKIIALNLPIDGIWHMIRAFHTHVLRFDVNDPRTSLVNGGAFDPQAVGLWRFYLPVEDFVANPLHQVLVLLALATLVITVGRSQRRTLVPLVQLAITVTAAFLLYCLLLKWQIWANRLLLPVFVLSAPITAYWLGTCLSAVWQKPVMAMLGTVAIVYSFTALHRPIVPLPLGFLGIYPAGSVLTLNRTQLYFNYLGISGSQKAIQQAYQSLVEPVVQRQCNFVALETSGDSPEYLLWAMFRVRGAAAVKLQHHSVNNESSRLSPEFSPSDVCIVLNLIR